jgi:hypothetical protein
MFAKTVYKGNKYCLKTEGEGGIRRESKEAHIGSGGEGGG